jgi:hypothetical protein
MSNVGGFLDFRSMTGIGPEIQATRKAGGVVGGYYPVDPMVLAIGSYLQ